MKTPKNVTGLVVLLIAFTGCKAKFTSVNGPKADPAGAAAEAPTPPPTSPNSDDQMQVDPELPVDQGVPQGGIPMTPGQSTPRTELPPPVDQAPICDTGSDKTIDPTRTLSRRRVTFKTGKVMVWRKNCEGKVFSKKYETMDTLKNVSVVYPNARTWTVYNRTACSSMALSKITKRGKPGEFFLTVSLNSTPKALQVVPGENVIDYEINSRTGVVERGTLILTVDVRRYSKDDCLVLKAKNCAVPPAQGWQPGLFGYGQH